MSDMQRSFVEVVDHAQNRLSAQEHFIATLAGEETDFVRMNHGRVRQAGHVRQAMLGFRFLRENRSVDGTLSLSGNMEDDRARLDALIVDLREAAAVLPQDPYFLVCTDAATTAASAAAVLGTHRRDTALSKPHDAVAAIADLAKGRDLVGIWASGTVMRGLISSYGKRRWREAESFHFDWSVYLSGDKAAKSSFAGTAWNEAELAQRFRRMDQELEVLARPPRTVPPGEYRAYLSPSAMGEILDVLSWNGFSKKAQATKQSPLMRLADGTASLDPRITVSENVAGGLAPPWNANGFDKPDLVPLIASGQHAGALVSPRSAREYDATTNGADDGETPTSLDMTAGDLPLAEAAKRVGDGVFVNNLWYLNFSDRTQGRITGMTRFATFLVEGGELVCPLNVMRFDDSIFRLFGPGLVALTRERELMPSTSTYSARSVASAHLPGAVVQGFRFTL